MIPDRDEAPWRTRGQCSTAYLKCELGAAFFVGIRVGFLKEILRFVYFLGVKTGIGNSCRFLVSVIGGLVSADRNGIIGFTGRDCDSDY